MSYKIAKSFNLEFGHRVWTQSLDKEFSLDCKCACRFKHGHSGKIKVFLKSDKLSNNMVLDFKMLNWFKKFIDDNLDHKFILDINDPIYKYDIEPKLDNINIYLTEINTDGFSFKVIVANNVPDYVSELLESYVFVDFVPTSENLCKWFYDGVTKKMNKLNVKVAKIQFFETEKSESNYYGNN